MAQYSLVLPQLRKGLRKRSYCLRCLAQRGNSMQPQTHYQLQLCLLTMPKGLIPQLRKGLDRRKTPQLRKG